MIDSLIFFYFIEAVVITDGRFGHRLSFSSLHSVSCSSCASQSSLASCSRSVASCGYKCTQNYGIICYGEKFDRKDCFACAKRCTSCNIYFITMHTEPGHDGCMEGSVRLVNSTIEYEGRVEVCVDGVWSTVCGVGALDAATICRVAGYPGGII